MGKFIADLIRTVLSSLLVWGILMIATYSMITHEFPPKLGKLQAAWGKFNQLTEVGGAEGLDANGKMPIQFQQIAENLIKGPENMDRMEKELKDLRERLQTLERMNKINPAQAQPSH